MDKQQLNEILAELYALDGSLKSRETELVNIINNIIKSQPSIEVNQDFIARLRSEVMAEAARMDMANQLPDAPLALKANHMNRFVYSFYGAMATVVVAVVAVVFISGGGHKPAVGGLSANEKAANAPKFSKLSGSAFGSLASAANVGGTAPMGAGGAENNPLAANAKQAPAGGGASAMMSRTDSKIMPPYGGKTYKFIYKGQELKQELAQLDVMKRIKGGENSVDTRNLISGLNVNYADLNTFPDQKIQNINFIQKSDYGYITNVSLDEGMISIYQNWETWPSGKCGNDNKCFEALRVGLNDMPSDQDLIAIADGFVSSHGIDRASFGDPEVNADWRRQYELTSDKADYYFPDSVEVIYPLKLDGKFVYDEYSGAKSGLSVSVQVKDRKVSSVNNLTTQAYDTSAYEMETDAKKIVAYAEKGGLGGVMYWGDDKAKVEDLELSDPEMVFVRQYIYKDNQNTELYVPALAFPIVNPPKEPYFNRKAVIIPLAKEILNDRLNEGGAGSPGTPMPLDVIRK